MKITETQGELINLLCANISNANIYCETLIEDKSLPSNAKNEFLRPMHTHLKYLKKAIDLRVSPEKKKMLNDAFGDSMVYDEVARMMIHLSPDGRAAVEEFTKSIFAKTLL